MPSSRRFKCTGRYTYGLAEWDVGHANPERYGHSRHSLAGEILHRLDASPAPVRFSEMRGHLRAGFTATMGSINSSLRRLDGLWLRIDEGGFLHRRCGHTGCEDAQYDHSVDFEE